MAEYANVGCDFETITKDQEAALFKHLRKHQKFDVEYACFCVEMIAFSIDDYVNGLLNTPSTYNDYQYAQNDAIKAYELYYVCKGAHLEKYRATLYALWQDLTVIARNIYQSIPQKKSRGRPKTTALRNAMIASIYRLYDQNEYGIKSENSHFERTVGMVLTWLEPDAPQDLHSLIMRALKVTERK